MLRDRQHLAEDGILIVVLTLEKGSNQLFGRTRHCISWIRVCAGVGRLDGRGEKDRDGCGRGLPDAPEKCGLEQD